VNLNPDRTQTVIIDSLALNSSHGIAVDNAGDVYITGARNTSTDLHVAKITDDGAPTLTPTPNPRNQPPVAVASANPESGDAPLAVQFSSDGSNDLDGSVVTYAWDFGDGGSSTEVNPPSYTYNTVGTYKASLTITDDTDVSQSDVVHPTPSKTCCGRP
jgi:PKD repeat protein